MVDELEIRPAKAEDTEGILELMRVSLGEGGIPRDRAYWRWKHEENPFGTSPCLLAVTGDEVVGLRVFMRWSWRAQDRSWAAVRAVDTATHPDWRGRGIFTRLTLTLLDQMKAEGVDFVFNTPNEKSRAGYLKMGWQKVGRVSLWIRPIRLSALAAAVLDGSDSALVGQEETATASVGRQPSALFEESGLEAFLEAVHAPERRLTTPRTTRYLRWRYETVPGIRYRAAWEWDGLRGALVVFRLRRRDRLLELRLCDVLVGPGSGSRRVARDLIRGLISDANADYAAAMAVTGASQARLLGPAGFLPAPRMGPIMTVRPVNDRGALFDLMRRSRWHLSIGDLELF